MTIRKINIGQKFSSFSEYWKPYIIGDLNGQYVKVVKFRGTYDWHHHENEDEMFLVVKGRFNLELRDSTVEVGEGEFVIVPCGVDHRPVADEECHALLFEPVSTLNTGNVRTDKTLEELGRI